MDEATERDLEALMRQRRTAESRLNRALAELLGSGRGTEEAAGAIAALEEVLRSLAGVVRRIEDAG
jgi:hypothetical protein